MFDDTLTVLRYPTVVDHGASVPNLAGTPTTVTVPRCDAQPGAPVELLDRREASEIQWTVYAPAGTSLLATDFAKLNGGARIYQVAGTPAAWGDGARSVDHVVIYLRASEVH
jgi:hypothetical protein